MTTHKELVEAAQQCAEDTRSLFFDAIIARHRERNIRVAITDCYWMAWRMPIDVAMSMPEEVEEDVEIMIEAYRKIRSPYEPVAWSALTDYGEPKKYVYKTAYHDIFEDFESVIADYLGQVIKVELANGQVVIVQPKVRDHDWIIEVPRDCDD